MTRSWYLLVKICIHFTNTWSQSSRIRFPETQRDRRREICFATVGTTPGYGILYMCLKIYIVVKKREKLRLMNSEKTLNSVFCPKVTL